MSDIWVTSISEIVGIFSKALRALLPSLESAHIPWKQGEAYDEWDEICQVLFRNYVSRSILFALNQEVSIDRLLPKYNLVYDNYADFGRIEFSSRKQVASIMARSEEEFVFVSLSTVAEPFDTLDYIILGQNEKPKSKECNHMALKDAKLFFRYKNLELTKLTVPL